MSDANSTDLIVSPVNNPETSILPQPSAPGMGLRPRSILDLTNEQFARLQTLAGYVSRSQMSIAKMGQSALNEQDVMLIFLEGLSLGMSEMSAIKSIDLIAGKPTLDAQGMLGLINASGLLEDIEIDSQDAYCSVTMKRVNRQPHTERYSLEDAAKMTATEWVSGQKKTIPLTEKSNWRQQPRTMLKWRCVAACARVVFPDIVQGMYTPDEMSSVEDVRPAAVRVERPAAPTAPQITASSAPGDEVVIEHPQQPAPHWATVPANQKALTDLLTELGLKGSEVLPKIEPGRSLTKWTDTTLDKDALFKRLREIAAAVPPAAPKGEKPRYGGAPAARQDYAAALLDLARGYFGLSESEVTELAGENWRTAYPNLDAAWGALVARTMNAPEKYPIYVNQAIYHPKSGKAQPYIEFIGPHKLTMFGRSTGFRAMVGDAYYNEWGVGEWDKHAVDGQGNPVVHDIGELLITWTVKDGRPIIKDVETLPDLPDDVLPEEDHADALPAGAVDLNAVFPR
ncbi:MAG: recombinase RecT [Anaerolineae bacterium]|nr:recombinase RecT [Anaerolineae bacterium]